MIKHCPGLGFLAFFFFQRRLAEARERRLGQDGLGVDADFDHRRPAGVQRGFEGGGEFVGFFDHRAIGPIGLGQGGEIAGKVTFLSRDADPTTRTFRVEITVDNGDLALRSGQTAEIAIQADGAMAHLLPSSVLTLDDEGTLGVRTVAEDDTALFMPVQVLRDTRDGIWVTGLPDSAKVITVGQEYVTDGVPVAPSYEDVIQ